MCLGGTVVSTYLGLKRYAAIAEGTTASLAPQESPTGWLTPRHVPDRLIGFTQSDRIPPDVAVTDPPDERSALALGMAWASRVTTICLEMVIPGLIGHWADQWLGTGFVLLVLGVILGLVTGMWHLIQVTRLPGAAQGNQRPSGDEKKQS